MHFFEIGKIFAKCEFFVVGHDQPRCILLDFGEFDNLSRRVGHR
jgi:hypothetical protein